MPHPVQKQTQSNKGNNNSMLHKPPETVQTITAEIQLPY